MKNIFNVSDEEKNRIRGLHLTESNNKKISSALSEQLLYPEAPWFRPDCMKWAKESPSGGRDGGISWGGYDRAVCTVGPNKGKYIDPRLCGDYGGQIISAVYLGIPCEECCESGSPSSDDVPRYEYDFPQNYYDCVGEAHFTAPIVDMTFPREIQKIKNHYLYCTKEPYYGIPIMTDNYIVQDKLIGVAIEVCCGDKSLNRDIDIEIDVETPRQKKGCTWRPEPVDEPTLGPNGYSINNHKICHEGDKVKLIQEVLLEEGYDLGKSGPNRDGVDGKFGRKTKKAVQEYQRKYDLPISCNPNCDGIVGDETWKHMFAEEEIKGIELPIITPDLDVDVDDDVIDIEDELEPMTDKELADFIEDNLENKTKRKECVKTIKKLSKKIKKSSPDTIRDLVNNEELKITLGYCLDERNYPLIAGHVKRVKKAFGLKGKGNI